jgi:hypothetical protein
MFRKIIDFYNRENAKFFKEFNAKQSMLSSNSDESESESENNIQKNNILKYGDNASRILNIFNEVYCRKVFASVGYKLKNN